MRLFHLSLLLFSVLLCGGCLGEDTDSCPGVKDNNLTLEFVLTDEKGNDVFPDKIHKVDVFIFDRAGQLVERQTVDRNLLSFFAGTELYLNPGDYRIVCWGNAGDKTVFDEATRGCLFADASVSNCTLNEYMRAANGDPLYYGPQTTTQSQTFIITVPEQGSKTASVSFCRAHIKIEVYIKGFVDKTTQNVLLPPIVELTNIPGSYDFEMQSFGSAICYRDVTSYRNVEGKEMAVIDFYTPCFEPDAPIQVLIGKSSDESIVTTINLKEFIEKNNIDISNHTETVIPILVEYKQASVDITLPGWGQTPIEPDL